LLPPKLAELVDGMNENRKAVLDLVAGLSEEEFLARAEGEWSVGEVLEHVILSETGTSKVIRKVLKENAGRLPPYPADDSVLAVRPFHGPSEEGRKAPESALPKGTMGKAELLEQAALCREQTLRSIAMLAEVDPRSGEFPHVAFGSMNLYEWAVLIVLGHQRQHLRQVAEIVRKLRGR